MNAPPVAAKPSHVVNTFRALSRMRCSIKLLLLAVLILIAPAGVFAQNNFASTIQNLSAMQSSLTQQMINYQGAISRYSGTSTAPEPCLPPFELQRGLKGEVPPELQGDPRYQQYLLRCRPGQSNRQSVTPAPGAPPLLVAHHLPITATDFVPAQYGHPVVDQMIASMPIAPNERLQLRNAVELMFGRVASEYRGNNLAVSIALAYSTALFTLNGSQQNAQQSQELILGINDALAQAPQFARMSSIEKQNNSDSLIFLTAMIVVLRDLGQRDPQAGQQAIELSRVVLKGLMGT